ncbi:MAG: enoyl-CoA hydratase [Acidiferrobacteraceae bacterium]|nr:enoyl-CoA hydratase [Acidiferrobacteraceae bacterium]
MIDLTRHGNVFLLTMNDGENRWNTTFTRAYTEAIDEVERSEGPAALVTASASEKFFSNGLDLEWRASEGEHRGGDRAVFGREFMGLMGRLICLPVPTVCAINGHAFGAGLMLALTHDIRLMRMDRGYVCANEVEIGMVIPDAELALFRHKLPVNAFFETVQMARRWTGPDALDAGIVHQVEPLESLLDAAMVKGEELSRLGANRAVYGRMKERIFGENSALDGPHGAAHVLRSAFKNH